ncbi:Pre-mRNA-splicing factor SLU7 [Aphelenchoides besseyi]|nr:Pre-mRNA-splicing factor SLU7 [Aphelenchoides besseyi]
MAGPNLPVSALLKQGGGLDDELDKRRSTDEYRKQKDLEEKRKAGTAPALVDVETGRDINPHTPEFIVRTPWYVPTNGPTLKHQRPHPERQRESSDVREWCPKGTTQHVAKRFRRGACENCGAIGHKERDCLERPRQKKAKWTETNFAPDDFVVPKLCMNYAAKRDRWNGYDPAEYQQVIEEHERMEMVRTTMQFKKIEDGIEPKDEDKYADDLDSHTRTTVRNLRIREDTAVYLLNLKPDAPHYDPKSRSMREKFTGYTGEASDANQSQMFALKAHRKGIEVYAQAAPTKLEILRRNVEEQKKKSENGGPEETVGSLWK